MPKPFGNLSFEDYTFATDAEKLVVALQAAMKVNGSSEKSAAWKKLQRLKKAMKRSKYTFELIPKEKVAAVAPEKTGPEHDFSDLLSGVVANCLGIERKKYSSRNTSAGYAIVTVICVGKLRDLRIPPGPEDIVTEARFKREVEERCFLREKRFSSVSVLNVRVKESKKKKYCLATVEVSYR